MSYQIERAFSTTEKFSPYSWSLYDVVPLFDDEGHALAYCGLTSSRTRSELPTEIFNHELKNLDTNNASEVAEFMSAYGMIGSHGIDRSDFAKYMLSKQFNRLDSTSVYEFEEFYKFQPSLSFDESGAISRERITNHYNDLEKGMLQIVSDEKGTSYNKEQAQRICCVVSDFEVQETISSLQKCVKITKAIMQSADPCEIAALSDVSIDDLDKEIQASDRFVNTLLSGVSPQIGIRKVHDGKTDQPSFRGSVQGSFEQAVALQLWVFALNGGSFRICKECGEVFQKKRSDSKKSTPRASSEFCCDLHRNRYSQREHRKTEGYKLKQQKKKAKSTQ